jgi:hypothetical protein
VPVIDRLQRMMEPLYDDFSLSQAMRKRFRVCVDFMLVYYIFYIYFIIILYATKL